MAKRAVLLDFETKVNRTDPSSNYGWSKLSPDSQDKRRKKLVRERHDLLRKVTKISDATSKQAVILNNNIVIDKIIMVQIHRCFFDRHTRRRASQAHQWLRRK